ncbi:MAG: hypothetical protein DDT30_01762 [Dehalococcoidia bacterium]|nr:hypothetical protein [Bacillota bacterium]
MAIGILRYQGFLIFVHKMANHPLCHQALLQPVLQINEIVTEFGQRLYISNGVRNITDTGL